MCRKQRIVMYLFHFLGHLVLYLNAEDEMLWGLYGCEFAFFFISNGIYCSPHVPYIGNSVSHYGSNRVVRIMGKKSRFNITGDDTIHLRDSGRGD